MAFFEDKRKKPVNIYKKGSPTAKAQGKMNNAVGRTFHAAANVADKYAGGAGVRQMGRTVKQKVVDPVVKPVMAGRDRQRTFMANQAENKSLAGNRTAPEDREAMEITYGDDGRTVGGNAPGMQRPEKMTGHGKVTNMPATGPTMMASRGKAVAAEAPGVVPPEPEMMASHSVGGDAVPSVADENLQQPAPRKFGVDPMQAGSGMIRNESTGEVVSMGPGGNIITRDSDGNVIDKPTELLSSDPVNQMTRKAVSPEDIANNRSFRVGNMDVVFDDGTSPEAKKAFFTRPVRPTAHIARAEAMRNIPVQAAPAQRTFGPSSSRSGKDRSKMTMGELAVDSSIRKMDNRERTVANQETQTSVQAQNNSERNANERERTFYQGQNVAGQNAARASTIAKTQQDMDQNKTLTDLQDRYRAEKDPVKKKALERQIRAFQGQAQPQPKIFSERQLDPETDEITTTSYRLDENGKPVRLIPKQYPSVPSNRDSLVKGQIYQSHMGLGLGRWDGKNFRLMELDQYGTARPSKGPQQQAPQKALESLSANPHLAQQFQEKYGYLPQGAVQR